MSVKIATEMPVAIRTNSTAVAPSSSLIQRAKRGFMSQLRGLWESLTGHKLQKCRKKPLGRINVLSNVENEISPTSGKLY